MRALGRIPLIKVVGGSLPQAARYELALPPQTTQSLTFQGLGFLPPTPLSRGAFEFSAGGFPSFGLELRLELRRWAAVGAAWPWMPASALSYALGYGVGLGTA